jgi:ketosteroid isomerase-like protein
MTTTTLGALVLALAQCATTEAKPLPPDLASLVDAERSFARASLSKGTRSAFLEYLGEDAVLFRPEPVKGRAWYSKRPESSSILVWEPAFADVSESNDLGYTTGPWAFRPDSTAEATAFGHYVSVWQRGADREWKVAIDVGVSHARVERPKSLVAPAEEKLPGVVTQQEALAAIQQEERDFVEAAARGIEDAFDTFAGEEVRLYRTGDVPTLGKDKARALLVKQPGTRHMQTTAAEAARAGDLGFTYGRCDVTYNAKVSTSYYLRIWKRMPDNTWKIVLDLDSPLPDKE